MDEEKPGKPPFFSVIVPLYNKARSVERCIESVVTQTEQDFELIVVDDGSTDESPEIVEGYGERGVRLVRQENFGGAGGQARNTGMKVASGRWFAFLDADDMWLPGHLAELRRTIEEQPSARLMSTRPIELMEGVTIDHLPPEPQGSSRRLINYFLEAANNIGVINCSSTAIHREVFERIGGFRNFRSGPDLEYWVRVAMEFPIAVSTAVTSVYFRGNEGNMERLARLHAGKSREISRLEDLSPSVRTICELRGNHTSLLEVRPELVTYVNSRIFAGVRGAIYRKDVQSARKIASFFVSPKSAKHWLLIAALKLPEPLVLMLRSSFLGSKSVLNSTNRQIAWI